MLYIKINCMYKIKFGGSLNQRTALGLEIGECRPYYAMAYYWQYLFNLAVLNLADFYNLPNHQ